MGTIKKCLFPVAGYGTRFLPVTKAVPKEMLPLVNKPLIQYGVEEAVGADLREIAFVTGRNKRAIEDYFDVSHPLEPEIAGTDKEKPLIELHQLIGQCTFSYTRQHKMRGLGAAILAGESLIGHRVFGVVLADHLCVTEGTSVLEGMVSVFEARRCTIVALVEVDRRDTGKYGIIAGEVGRDGLINIQDMVEKPAPDEAPSTYAILGRYILTPDIFPILHETPPGADGELQLTDALRKQAQRGGVLGYVYRGRSFDCGSVEGFMEATKYLYACQHKTT